MYLPKALMLVFVVDASRPQLFPVARQHLHELLASDPRLPLMVLANKQVSVTGSHSKNSNTVIGCVLLVLSVWSEPDLPGPPRGLRHHRPPRRPLPVGGRRAQAVPHRHPRQKGPSRAQLRDAGRLGSDPPAGWEQQIIPVFSRVRLILFFFLTKLVPTGR